MLKISAVTAVAVALSLATPAQAGGVQHSASSTPTVSTCPPRPSFFPTIDVVTPGIRSGESGLLRVTGEAGTIVALQERHAGETEFAPLSSQVRIPVGGVTSFQTSSPTSARYRLRVHGGGPITGPCPRPFYGGITTGREIITAQSILSLTANQIGTRTYRFAGLAKGHDGDYVNLYRAAVDRRGIVVGGPILTSQTRSKADRYSIVRTFLGSGRFAFFVATGTDPQNTAGRSSNRVITV